MVFRRLPDAGTDILQKSYRIAHPKAEPDRRTYCIEAGDQTIRQHIMAGDHYDDLVVIKALIEKGALLPSSNAPTQ